MWQNHGLTSMLPPETEGRTFPLLSHDAVTAPALPERPSQTVPPPTSEMPPRGSREDMPAGSFRRGSRPNVSLQSTIRAVTPEPVEARHDVSDTDASAFPQPTRGLGSMSPQSSPRSISGPRAGAIAAAGDGMSVSRRQGVVFNDTLSGSLDSSSSSPPPKLSPFRPRTHTMDGAIRQQLAPTIEGRHRVGSFSSAGSLVNSEDLRGPLLQSQLDSLVLPPVSHNRPADLQITTSAPSKEKKIPSRSRLVKRVSSRPSSPLVSPPPSVDSLPLPIPTNDANRILLLMKTLCGKMKGEVEYQAEVSGPWHCGFCYIEEEKGSLMFDSGDMGPFHTAILPDLRGCRILPIENNENVSGCLEIANLQLGIEILLRPLVSEEFDLWLAALLCWQQLRPSGVKLSNGRSGNNTNSGRAEMKRRASSSGLKDAAIIKVGKVMLWDKGLATSPRAIVKRPSTRDLRSSQTAWRRVSCILQDNGEFKLMTENDITVLSVIGLSQLARCAIQPLDKSVLEEEFCIGIFPIYCTNSTQLSIFRPVYIALDSRVLFEVWFVLLRAFTVPGVYALDPTPGKGVYEVTDFNVEPTSDHFRVEKTVSVRVTEAKFRTNNLAPDSGLRDRHTKSDQGALVGNYLAEVILDGEVRARTTTKTDTKNPFWREDCDFVDLPSTLPFLSVLLKRVEGNLETLNPQLQASVGLPKTGNLAEVLCGCVEIPLDQMERGKDHEQWLPILDERQQSIGTMLVKVHHEELVVLSTQEYKPLSELLHRFSSGLTLQIAEALPGNLRRLAEVLLNIFQVSRSATEWLMNLVEDEIDGIGNQGAIGKPRFSRRLTSNESMESSSDREQIVRDMSKSLAGEANLLFRGNSLLTQALEFHMRRLGKEYLEETLSDKISEINELNSNCEVDPSKLQHGEDIQKHWAQLMQFTTQVWECIAPSANRVPPELRHILKYIRAVAEDRYGDFLRTVTYTSVSGFLFLRFICPAILNPKLFGLLRDHPRPRAQRTLTLIAKTLQALANLSSIGKKETWTQPMNHFLSTQRQSVKDFIDQICAIPMERTTVTLPASYSTPITILGRLSPLLREGFPSLPYLIDHPRNFAMLVKLWTDVNTVTPSSSTVKPGPTRVFEGDLLEFDKLCKSIQRCADERHVCIGSLRAQRLAAVEDNDSASAGQIAAMEADRLSELADAFDQSSLADIGHASSYGISSTAVWADHEVGTSSSIHPPGSSGSEMEGSGLSEASLRESRFGSKESSSLRHVSGSSGMGSPAGTMRGLKNGKQARKFLSGFIRKGARTLSPDATALSGPRAPIREERSHGTSERDWLRDKERRTDRDGSQHAKERRADPDRDGERNVLKDRNKGLGLASEPWQADNNASMRGRR